MKFVPAAIASLSLVPLYTNAWAFSRSPLSLWRPMVTYSPVQELLEESNALVNRAFTHSSPRYEIINNEEKFQVAVDIPGFKADDVKVNLEEDGKVLSISGSRASTGDTYSFESKFSQSFWLDPAIEKDKFTANIENGVLVISAPKEVKKIEEATRNIPVTQMEGHKEEVPIQTAAAEKVEKEKVET